jgi:DNA-binding NarL/FixJ family response regulator
MTDEDWHILEDTIEKTHPGFQKRLLSFKRLSTQEQHVCWLIKAGVSPIGIAQLTSRSKQSVSSSRARLYEKVFGQKGSPAQWDEFILSL